ncbi:MAG: hypothetical protein WAU58_02230 [Terriglobales bacterium]
MDSYETRTCPNVRGATTGKNSAGQFQQQAELAQRASSTAIRMTGQTPGLWTAEGAYSYVKPAPCVKVLLC